MLTWLANYLIRRAMRTPYNDLRNTDRTLYMGRYWLVPELDPEDPSMKPLTWRRPLGWLLQLFGIAVRIHHIADIDRDLALHDHPWSFISVVLRGSYCETRPVRRSPCFLPEPVGVEDFTYNFRTTGSIAYRRATDRHRIVDVRPDTWTLFITLKKVQWWGFYTLRGKIYYKDYETEHNTRGFKG